MVKEIEYTQADGSKAIAAYVSAGAVYQLGAKREKFAQLCAAGELPFDAYCQAYGIQAAPDTIEPIKEKTRRLLNDTAVVLRIQELKRPVLRKVRRKIEYGLQRALEQCETAYDLAFEQGDVKGLLAAIRMQSELGKLLSQDVNVNHRYGLLDDASTEVLLAMRKEIEVRRAKQNGKLKTVVEKVETVSETPHAPSLVPSNGAPSEAVPK